MHRPPFSPKATINDKFKEIGAGLAVIGSIVSAFLVFMDRTGISGDIAASYGDAIKDLVLSLGVVLSIIAGVRFLHDYGIAGADADPIGTGPREEYDALRKSLAAHEDAEDGYAHRLKKFLARDDTFFGDAGKGKQRFFLLRDPAALWTAPAFDRCLLLALCYPVMTILVIWAVSGEVGPAEQALQLKTTDGPNRFAAITLAGIEILAFWRFLLAQGWRRLAWLAATFAFASLSALPLALALSLAFSLSLSLSVALSLALALALWLSLSLSLSVALALSLSLSLSLSL